MKKITKTIIALSVLTGLASCAKEQTPVTPEVNDRTIALSLTAGQENSETRAAIDGTNSTVINWAKNDKISGVVISAEQTATAGSFDPSAALMCAQSSSADGALSFKNVVGYVKFTTDFDCSKIALISNTDTDTPSLRLLSLSKHRGAVPEPAVAEIVEASRGRHFSYYLAKFAKTSDQLWTSRRLRGCCD